MNSTKISAIPRLRSGWRACRAILVLALGLMVCSVGVSEAVPMGTAFTYQGRLMDANEPADGVYEFQFDLYDSAVDGNQLDGTVAFRGVDVIDGYFTVELDFGGAVFDGDACWLEISVRPGDVADPFTILSPRQEVTPAPYAIYAESAGGDNDWMVSGGVMYSIPGKVGIGTTDPKAKLFVQMPSAKPPWGVISDGLIIKDGENCIGNPLEVQKSTGSVEFFVDGGGLVGIGTSPEGATIGPRGKFEVSHDRTSRDLVVNASTGNVGIGTRSPDSRLHILAEGKVGVHSVSDADGVVGHNTGGSGRSGVYGETNATNNYGVFGRNNAPFTHTWGFLGGPYHGASGYCEDSVTGDWTYGYLSGSFCAVYGEASGTEAVAARFVGDVQVMSKGGTSARLTTPTLEITGGADLSEQFEIRGISADIQPSAGLVVSIDPESPGDLVVSNKAYDRRVAGIISGAGGVNPGVLMGQEGSKADGKNPVALTGRVYCWADASKGPIEPGDLLTTSDTAGHAMKVNDYELAQGAILGKAMSALEEGQGLVLVLVTLQ